MIAIMNIISPLAFAISDIIVINPNLNQNESKQKYLVQNTKFANSRNSNSCVSLEEYRGTKSISWY